MDNTEIISAIKDKKNFRKDIAPMYEELFESNYNISIDHEGFWRTINEAIINRWSNSGLIFIKELAWKIHYKKKNLKNAH